MPTTVFRFLFLAMALFTTATALAAPQRINQPNPNDPMKTEIYKLDNGLLVYLTENHESPRFYAEIATRAGSKMDPAESTGLAHYLEHMLFKGTDKLGSIGYDQEKPFLDEVEALYEQHFKETDPEKRKELYRKINEASAAAAQFAVPNEIDRLYKSMGATDVNAHTWHEETVYKVDLPANRIEQWATIESERFRKPVLRLFPTELEAVYEEMNRALDNKQRIITYAVDGLLYKKHPYGQQPTLGVVEHLKNPSLTNINRYYETYYVPNNMAIFISGDINTAETLALIDRYFGAWQPKDVPPVGTWEEAPINGREFVETTYRGEEYVLLAFRTASNKSADAEALIVLDMMLDNATAGLINLNLNQKQVVRQAGSYPQQYNDYGAQYLYGIPKEGQTLEEVEKLLLGQLDILKRGEIEDWVIPAIVNDFKKNKKAGLEDDTARVSAMRSSWIDLNDWDHAVAQIERIEKVTKEDVVRVANQYFGANYVCGYRRDAAPALPTVEKPEITKVDIDPSRLSDFGKAVMAMPVKEIEPVFIDPAKDYTIEKAQKGVDLYYVPNPINDIFSLTFSIEFGNHQDNTINTAAGLLQKSGTEKFTAEELKKEWYKLGTEFGIGAGDNETTITLTGLDENFEASVALLMKLLSAPKVEEAVLEEMKQIILAEREDSMKQPEVISAALVQYNRYGADSYFLRMQTKEEVLALTVAKLQPVIQGLLNYKHVASYTGTLPLDTVKEVLKKHYPKGTGKLDPPPYTYLKARAPEATEIYVVNKEAATANIRIEFGSVDYNPELAVPSQLYNSYFGGGMAGIVFQELREARALAYSVGARYNPGYRENDQNIMAGGIQTQADKSPEAIAAFLDLLDNLPESEDRLSVSKDSILSLYRTGKVGFRSIAGTVRDWERKGLQPDPRKEWFGKIQAAGLPEVLAFHKEYLKNKPKLISVVGDTTKMDLEGLKKSGQIKDITVEQVFVD